MSYHYHDFLYFCSGAQLNEALQMQVEVQRRLSDQLEVIYLSFDIPAEEKSTANSFKFVCFQGSKKFEVENRGTR